MPDFICKQISKKNKKSFIMNCIKIKCLSKRNYHLEMQNFVCIDTVVTQFTTRFVDFDVISYNKTKSSTKKLADKYNLAKPAIQK